MMAAGVMRATSMMKTATWRIIKKRPSAKTMVETVEIVQTPQTKDKENKK
jgi:hypothetical protein